MFLCNKNFVDLIVWVLKSWTCIKLNIILHQTREKEKRTRRRWRTEQNRPVQTPQTRLNWAAADNRTFWYFFMNWRENWRHEWDGEGRNGGLSGVWRALIGSLHWRRGWKENEAMFHAPLPPPTPLKSLVEHFHITQLACRNPTEVIAFLLFFFYRVLLPVSAFSIYFRIINSFTLQVFPQPWCCSVISLRFL